MTHWFFLKLTKKIFSIVNSCNTRNFIMYFKPCVKYGKIIFGTNSVFIYEWGIQLWVQRFFRKWKRSSDEKVTTKTEKTGNWPFGQKAVVSGREWLATMALWHCRMAKSQGLREWRATMPFWHSRGHSRPYCLIRVFNLISFLILTQNISPLLSLGFSQLLGRFWSTIAYLQIFSWIKHHQSYHSWKGSLLLPHQAPVTIWVSFLEF